MVLIKPNSMILAFTFLALLLLPRGKVKFRIICFSKLTKSRSSFIKMWPVLVTFLLPTVNVYIFFPVYGFGCELFRNIIRDLWWWWWWRGGDNPFLGIGFPPLKSAWISMATAEILFWQWRQISWLEEDDDHVVLIVLQPLAAVCNEFYWSCIFKLQHLNIYNSSLWFDLEGSCPQEHHISQRWGLALTFVTERLWGPLSTVWSALLEHIRFPPAEHITQATEPRLLQTC